MPTLNAPPKEYLEKLAELVKRGTTAIEGQNWTDTPLTEAEKTVIDMAIGWTAYQYANGNPDVPTIDEHLRNTKLDAKVITSWDDAIEAAAKVCDDLRDDATTTAAANAYSIAALDIRRLKGRNGDVTN